MRELFGLLLRRSLRSVLWTRGRTLATVVAFILLAIILGSIFHGKKSSSDVATASTPSVSSPVAISSTSVAEPIPVEASSPTIPSASTIPSNPAILLAAKNFVATWATHYAGSTARSQWYAKVKPLATDRLANELNLTDPNNISPTKVTGNPQTISTGEGQFLVSVPTDAGLILVQVVKQKNTWLIDSISAG